MKKITLSLCAILALSAASTRAHEHYAVGYLDTNGDHIADAGDQLQLVNTPSADAIFHMLMEPETKRYAGYYALDEQVRDEYPNDYFVFIALSDGQTEADGDQHAATGSDIWAEITSVAGPDGGHFGFWDVDPDTHIGWSYTHTTPTVSFAANESTGGYKFEISEPLTSPVAPTEDPFGHIHDRGFTADLPGTYTVGFTFYDMSTNGPDGGPIHEPSQTYYFTFVAGTSDPTPTPTPTLTPSPSTPPAKPTLRITGAKQRTVSSARVVIRGIASAPAGLSAVQLKTRGSFRTVSRAGRWKAIVPLKHGTNTIQMRALDALGRYSQTQRVVIRRR